MPNSIISRIKLDGVLYDIKDTTYGIAGNNVLGLIKTGYTTNAQNYAVNVDANGNAYVNVPWDAGVDTKYKTTLNDELLGDSSGTSLGSWYAPTTVGTAGQYLTSSGYGAPVWANFPTAGNTLGGIKTGYTSANGNWAVDVVNSGADAGQAYVNISLGTKEQIISTETTGKIWTGAVLTEWINDILGIDADAVSSLVSILNDSSTATGILAEIAKKADTTSIVTYTNGTGLTKTESNNGKTVTFDLKTGYTTNNNNFAVSTSESGAYTNVPNATTSAPGAMSAADKTKVDTGLVCTYDSKTETMEITWGAAPVAEPVTEPVTEP